MTFQKWFAIHFILMVVIGVHRSSGQPSIDYDYHAVPIGGGGYITGMVIHPNYPDVRYWRTDVGGAYRWNAATQAMEQMIFFGEEVDDYYGVAGIALDPLNENRVILAVGRKCNLNESAILESMDGGISWIVIPSPVYFAANGGRECSGGSDKDRQGNPISLNPLNNNELFIGSRGEGLWKLSLDASSFIHIAADSIPSNSTRKSIRNVLFHPVDTHLIFISYAGYGIFRGNTLTGIYEKISHGNLDLEFVSDLSFSKSGNQLFAACREKGILRCENPVNAEPTWELVLPYTGIDPGGDAFLTVSCSPTQEDVVATVNGDWNALNKFYISESNGDINTWINHTGTVQNNIFSYRTAGFGSHISQLVFDPIDTTSLYFTSWFTSMKTNNWNTANILWSNEQSKGHEEVVITDICAFENNSANNYLIHLGGDATGFLVDTIEEFLFPITTIRDVIDDPSQLIKGASVDICQQQSDHIVACFTKDWDNSTGDLAISDDGGASFARSTGYDDNLGKSVVALSSTDPDRVVIATKEGLKWSSDGGNTFIDAVSVNAMTSSCAVNPSISSIGFGDVNTNAINTSVFSVVRCLEADKSIGCLFYFYNWLDGSFHVSTDYGEHFMKVSDGLPTFVNGTLNKWRYKTRLQSTPNHPQHIWINFDTGLFHSMDGGQNWTQLSNVQNARLMGIGKTIVGMSYPTLFLYGKANGDPVYTYYRSTDKGLTWNKINNALENEQWGSPRILEGDHKKAGRYYIGTSGLGLIYGEAAFQMTIDTLVPEICCHLDSAVYECSGMIINRYDSYWTHNDANNDSTIFELNDACEVIREVHLQDVVNLDFEEMAQDDDGNFYIGEFGSKSGQLSSNGLYDSLYIYKIPNPDFHCESSVVPEVISFTYPSIYSFIGDTEAMFHDDGKIYLIPKIHNTNPNKYWAGLAMIFSIPGTPNPGGQYTATFIDSFDLSEYPLFPIDHFKVSAADLSPDKKTMVMMSGRRFWVLTDFTRGVFFDGMVTPISFPNQHQREAVAFADNHTIFIIDENNNYNPNRGNLVKANLCDFVPTIEDCNCPSTLTSENVFNYQNAVEEYESGFVNNGSSDLELVYDHSATGNQKVAIRFFDLGIPNRAHISSAYVQFTVDETDNQNPSALTIWAEAIGNSAVFTSDSFNVSQRLKSSNSVSWQPADWLAVGDAITAQRTPDLSILLQSIVNRPDWLDNNGLTLIIEGIGNRTAESHYHCNNSSPRLIVEYCMPPSLICEENLLLENNALFNGTYEANQLISSKGQVNPNLSTIFSAGNCVELSNGFEVNLGAEFTAEIGGCN